MTEPPTATRSQAKEAEKIQAIAALEEAISVIEQEDREPDRWERICLTSGISAIFSGLYQLAEFDGALALAKRNERVPDYALSSACDQYSLDILRRALSIAQREPVMQHPRFFRTAALE